MLHICFGWSQSSAWRVSGSVGVADTSVLCELGESAFLSLIWILGQEIENYSISEVGPLGQSNFFSLSKSRCLKLI